MVFRVFFKSAGITLLTLILFLDLYIYIYIYKLTYVLADMQVYLRRNVLCLYVLFSKSRKRIDVSRIMLADLK